MHSRYTQRRCCPKDTAPCRQRQKPPQACPKESPHKKEILPPMLSPRISPKGPERGGFPLLGGMLPPLGDLFAGGKEGDMMALLVLLLLLFEGKEEHRGTVLTLLFFFLL